MERLKLYCQDVCRGEITLRSEGGRTEIRASMEDPGDGLYRAVLRGESGELMLGVLAQGWGFAGNCTAGIWRALGPCAAGRQDAPSTSSRPRGGRRAALPSCFRGGSCKAVCGQSDGPGGGGKAACWSWPCLWRMASPFPWRPCSAWAGWSRWRGGGASFTPSGRKSPCPPSLIGNDI